MKTYSLCALLSLTLLTGCATTSEQGTEALARKALADYASRFRNVRYGFMGPPTFYGEARWSGMSGLCEADVMTVVRGATATRTQPDGSIHISLRQAFGVVGDLQPPYASNPDEAQIATEETACEAVRDSTNFFFSQDDDANAAYFGALAFQAVQARSSLEGLVLGSVAPCDQFLDRCVILDAERSGEHHTIRVTFWEGPPFSIREVSDDITYPLY